MRKFSSTTFLSGIFFALMIGFFAFFLIKSKLPIPTDALVGLYHPFRDFFQNEYPRGVPFKNFLITDPVLQQLPQRFLAVGLERHFTLPLWNPYAFSGTPLLATLQGGVLYPLNLFFFFLPFTTSWGMLIVLQPFLAMLFTYLYLRNLKLNVYASLLGGYTLAFSGFFVAWMEWGTIIHVALWLPLALLAIDKFFYFQKIRSESKDQQRKIRIKNKIVLFWLLLYLFSLVSAFFAGHLQTFFYLYVVTVAYFLMRSFLNKEKLVLNILIFFILNSSFILLTFVQWFPTFQFISLSARDVDQIPLQTAGWFIPWQNLVQFLAPDFFGNPTTLNYFGVWNYAEFVGYVGVAPLILSVIALFYFRQRRVFFFGCMFFISLLFSLQSIIAEVPFLLKVPFLSTAQPTRLLFLVDFSLAVLSAFGLQYIFEKKRNIIPVILFFLFCFLGLWVMIFWGRSLFKLHPEELLTAQRNLVLPTFFFIVTSIVIVILSTLQKQSFKKIISVVLLCIVIIDLFRFAQKFLPFSDMRFFYPKTKTIKFLLNQAEDGRIMATSREILPPNIGAYFKLQSIEGYDPLYLRRYGELIAASERGRASIQPPFGFNRIITPHNMSSKIIDLLGVKYILSFDDLRSNDYQFIFQEGKTKIFENHNAFKRAYFVKQVIPAGSKNEAIEMMFHPDIDLKTTAVVEGYDKRLSFSEGSARIISYSENSVTIQAENKEEGFLILTDVFYPTWHATIRDTLNNTSSKAKIFQTDYVFRGVVVPPGEHIIEFHVSLY